jgi:hypothetical protein
MSGATRRGAGVAPRAGWLLPPLALLAAACQGTPIGGRSPVEGSVAAYYAAHASEEGGVCLQPYMDGITAVRPVEETAEERRTVRVRYFYRDRFKTTRENAGTCIGFDERNFTLAEGPGGEWQVVDMSGPRRS